jgi:hypothetical protein
VQKGVNEMKNRVLYIVAMSISLLLSYGVYYLMLVRAIVNPRIIYTSQSTACAFITFAACEYTIGRLGLHFDFPFVTKRISRIMFDILIFLRFISVFPITHYDDDGKTIILYNLLSLIPLIIIFITEKKQAGDTPNQGFATASIVTILYIVSSVFINFPNTIIVFDVNINYDLILIVTTIIGIIVNLLISYVIVKNERNGGSPLLTAVSLFIATTPAIFTLLLFYFLTM